MIIMTTRQRCVELAKKLAKERDGYTCQKCSKKKPEVQIQGSHIFPVTYGNTAADPENIIALCSSCHEFARDSWHMSPLQSSEWFNLKFPGRYELLKSRALPIRPIKEHEWQDKLEQLKIESKERKDSNVLEPNNKGTEEDVPSMW